MPSLHKRANIIDLNNLTFLCHGILENVLDVEILLKV